MAEFGATSKANLETCHPIWSEILNKAIEIYNFSVLEGYRGKERQDRLFRDGFSKVCFPYSPHNTTDKNGSPQSEAVDIAPFPLYWDSDREQFLILAGIIKGAAHILGYKVRWGGDWDGDFDFKDQTFNDLAHFELIL